MADPISILSLALQLTPKIVRYAREVKEGSEERRRLIAEISGTSGVLHTLEELLKDPQSSYGTDDILTELGRDGGPLDCYSKLLQSIEKVLKPKEGLRQAAKSLAWPFRKDEIHQYLTQIERCKSSFLLALELDHSQLTRQIHENVHDLKDRQDVLIEKTEKLWKLRQGGTYQKISEWISSFDYSSKHRTAASIRSYGTGTWIFQDDLFKQWLSGDLPTLLCHGIPGAGKTILSSSIIDHLLENYCPGSGVGIAYFYFDYQDQQSQRFSDVFSNMLKQLVRFSPDRFREIYELHSSKSTNQSFSLDEVHALSHEIVALFDRAYIVIDALDECNEADRDKLISRLEKLQATSGRLHILITSRPKQVVSDAFPGAGLLEISANELDIQTYINERIKTERRLQGHLRKSPDLKSSMLETITSRCQGMFLLARFHLDSISRARTLADFEASLARLPEGSHVLTETYQQALKRINSQEPQDVQMAMKILMWVCFAARPLTADELRWALAIDISQHEEDFNEKRLLPEEDIISLCIGLVTISTDTEEVRLVHYTTQEFFDSQRQTLFPDANMNLFLSCMTFLSYSRFNVDPPQEVPAIYSLLAQNPFLRYAAKYLGEHARPVEKQMKSEIISFLQNDHRLNLIRQMFFYPSEYCWDSLAFTIRYRLEEIAAELVATGADVNSISTRGRRPAHMAARQGQAEIMRLLIANNADLHARDRYQETALMAAADQVTTQAGEIAEIILTKAPEIIDFADGDGATALHFAAESKNIPVIKVLLRHGADVDAKNCDGDTPLYRAAMRASSHAVKLLLEAGADPAQYEDDEYPLAFCATSDRSGDCLSMLLEHPNFDYAARDSSDGESSLHRSAASGSHTLVRLLLDHDRSHGHRLLDMRNAEGQTPLHLAVINGHVEVMRLLLAEGADPSVQDANGRTILHEMARSRELATVKELLQIEAVRSLLNVLNTQGHTPLHLAVINGHVKVMRLLLAEGADPTVRDLGGRTVLHWAAWFGESATVTELLLIEAVRGLLDAKMTAPFDVIPSLFWKGSARPLYEPHGTALHVAVAARHKSIAQELLNAGADWTEIKDDRTGQTAEEMSMGRGWDLRRA